MQYSKTNTNIAIIVTIAIQITTLIIINFVIVYF